MFKMLKIFYRFLFRHKARYLTFTACLVIWIILESIQPYFYKLFVDAIPSKNWQIITNILLLFLILRAANLIFDILTYWTGDRVLIPSGIDARTTIFKKVQDLDFAYHTSKSTGSLISTFKRGDGAFWSLFHSFNIKIVKVAIGFLVMMTILGRLDPIISIFICLSFALDIIITLRLVKNNINKRKLFNKEEDKISGIIVDNLINYETVKLFARENWEYNRLKQAFIPWEKKLWGYANSFRLIDIVIGSIVNIQLFLILLWTLARTMRGLFTIGDFIMVISFMGQFISKVYELIWNLRDIGKHFTDINRYFGILDDKTQVKDPPNPKTVQAIRGTIEFNNVSFSYPEGKKNALRDFSLNIRQGQSVAFVGRSGAGKTTVVKALLRFFDVDKGTIKIDGINIKDMKKSRLRSLIGVVPQEPILFNDTIEFNIGYARNQVSKKEIQTAAKLAYLNSFIQSLPHKYQTQVGERGIKLSGGQKQRLAIARMILADPEIIIFDEATSQLDSESEKYIQKAFWKAARNKTTLIIAHRLSTVMRADKIVVMQNGRIKEIGSHRELMNRRNSLYRHLWNLQQAKDLVE